GQRLNNLVAGLFIGALLGSGIVWITSRNPDERWLHDSALPELEAAVEAGLDEKSYEIARRIEERTPETEALLRLWPKFTNQYSIASDPPGARVYRRAYDAVDAAWEDLGTTPIADLHLPRNLSVLRFELDGYLPLVRTLFGGTSTYVFAGQAIPFKLDPVGGIPDDKVRVPGWSETVDGVQIEFGDFFLDRDEVTNREFKEFIDAGGYQDRRYWRHPILIDGLESSWEDAMAAFVDTTNRPGPAQWIGSDYPEGQDDYPVGGISWYEAAAYAEFVGEELPTVYHWRRAMDDWEASWVLPASNMLSAGPRPVAKCDCWSWPGAYDMAGNVREWTFNAVGERRYILGGGWNDERYMALYGESLQFPWDRSATNGFRLAVTSDDGRMLDRVRQSEPAHPARDVTQVNPVSDEVFDTYRSLLAYDDGPLNAVVEERLEQNDWVRERIVVDAAYNGERMPIYLYIPRTSAPPYQAVVFFPGIGTWSTNSFDQLNFYLDFLPKNGRAFAFPVYKGSLERRDQIGLGPLENANSTTRDRMIRIHQDVRRAVDYLESRRDIDSGALAYFGSSMGGQYAAMNLALEPRFKAAVLSLGGVNPTHGFLPEVDPLSYVARVSTPLLLLSGELDNIYPLETSAKPFFSQLGTPAANKKHVIAPGGHFIPREVLVRETLDWLDAYLGPVRDPR
ncbi:MAG: SUMF1/EgtB/PvdO family nonheme iron enzyme, partial [Gammaproteobacteria bacterium]